METKEMTLAEFAERFSSGEFKSSDRLTQCIAGWYDWFCKDSSLAAKTEYLGKKVLSILDSKKFNKTKSYVFFKNNCPCVGALYDQFSICDIETCDVLYCCQHLEKGSHGCDKAHWEIYGRKNDFKEPLIEGTWNECKKWFNA